MWSKTFKPGDVKVKRDVAMSAQAQLILRKKAEIEAKMAADGKTGEVREPKERKPISLSISKRWGLKGKKDGEGSSSARPPAAPPPVQPPAPPDDNCWAQYTAPPLPSTAPTPAPYQPSQTTSEPGLVPAQSQSSYITADPSINQPPPFTPFEAGRPSGVGYTQPPLNSYPAPGYQLPQPDYDLTRPPPPVIQTPQLHGQVQYDSSAPPPRYLPPPGPPPPQLGNAVFSPQNPPQGNHVAQTHHPQQPHQIPLPHQAQQSHLMSQTLVSTQQPSNALQAHLNPQPHLVIQPTVASQTPHTPPQYTPQPQLVSQSQNTLQPLHSILSHHSSQPQQAIPPHHVTQPPHTIPPPHVTQPQHTLPPPPHVTQPPHTIPPPHVTMPQHVIPPQHPVQSHHVLQSTQSQISLHTQHSQVQQHCPTTPLLQGPQHPTLPLHAIQAHNASHTNISQPAPTPPQYQSMTTSFYHPVVPPDSSGSHPPLVAPSIGTQAPPPILSQPPPMTIPPRPITHYIPPTMTQPPPSLLLQPPPTVSLPPPNISQPPPVDSAGFHVAPSHQFFPQPGPAVSLAPDLSQPPPLTSHPPPGAGMWWEGGREVMPVPPPDLGVDGRDQGDRDRIDDRDKGEKRDHGGRQRRDSRDWGDREKRDKGDRRNSSRDRERKRRDSRDQGERERRDGRESWREGRREERGERRMSETGSRDRGRERERGDTGRHRSRSRQRSREYGEGEREEGGGERVERRFREEKVKSCPRDIDMRLPKAEVDTKVKLEPAVSHTVLPDVVEELANMVAVSGEALEDVARDRNTLAPELRFLQEKSGPMYRSYRARVAQLREGLESAGKVEVKAEVKVESKGEPTKKRKSRWGAAEPSVVTPIVGVPPPQLSGPGVALPTQLGGLVVPRQVTTEVKQERSPALTAYAVRVFGTKDLTPDQWKQCEQQLKMNAVYSDIAAKQAMANARKAAGKVKYEYDSDEETEGGTWEHKARQAEMEKTAAEAAARAEEMDGGHHIGDFLPPEELAKFMDKCKALKSGSGWDRSEYQDNKLTQNNVGFQMLQKMGWSEGAGLGSSLQGITAPVGKAGQGAERQGLGADTGDLTGDDDEFDTYRKRMMLAYRFRPNPLNNPRRSYY